MERDDGYTKLQQLPCSDNFSLAASSSWPQPQTRSPSSTTSHICGYCKREFRSAQGLGGHMNVHRLDRARLIHHQCFSQHHHLALAAAPPPNPNPSRRTAAELLGSGGHAHGAAASVGGSAVAPAAKKPGVCSRFSLASSSASTKDIEVTKNLELSMGACNHVDSAEERLDLELRLGYS